MTIRSFFSRWRTVVTVAVLTLLVMSIVSSVVPLPVVAKSPVEITNLRTENSKIFDLGNGTQQLVVSMGAVHYKDNYSDKAEGWKDIDLTWEDNKITKAPYELTLEGNKVIIRDKRTGEVSTIELIEIDGKSITDMTKEKSKGLAKVKDIALDTDFEIVVESGAVRFTRVLKSDKAPTEAKFKVTGNFKVKAIDAEVGLLTNELPVEWSVVDGILTETLKPDRPVKYPVRIDPTWQVGASTDDCYLQYTGSWAFFLTLSEISPGYTSTGNLYKGGGMRFLNVTIPQGSTINTAYLIFTAYADRSTTTVNTRITGNDVDDAATWSTLADFQARRGTVIGGANDNYITAAQVAWDAIGSWVLNTAYNSPEIKTVIQEIIDRVGWASGNDLALFWDDFDLRSTLGSERRAFAYDGSTTKCPQLVITYTAPVAPTVETSSALVDGTSATLNGEITDAGFPTTDDYRGFVWDDTTSHANPGNVAPAASGYNNNWTESGSFGVGDFSYEATGLTALVTYYYRAVAHNDAGWTYGEELTFFTLVDGKVYFELRPDLDETKIRGQLGIPSDAYVGIFNGYSLPISSGTDNESLNYIFCVPDRWDGNSDILLHIDCALANANESGNAYKWKVLWEHFTPNEDVVPATSNDIYLERAIYSNTQYQSYQDWLVIDYNIDAGDAIEPDDLIAITLMRTGAKAQNDTGEIIVFAIDILFARGDFLADPEANIFTLILGWIVDGTLIGGASMYFFMLSIIPLGLLIAMMATKQMMLGFAAALFWAIFGGYSFTQSTATWDINYLLGFGSLLGMVPLSAFGAFALKTKKEETREGDLYFDEGGDDDIKYIDEGGGKGSGKGKDTDTETGLDDEKPSRRTREIRDRANRRRTRWD